MPDNSDVEMPAVESPVSPKVEETPAPHTEEAPVAGVEKGGVQTEVRKPVSEADAVRGGGKAGNVCRGKGSTFKSGGIVG